MLSRCVTLVPTYFGFGLSDSFKMKRPEDTQYTWWQYRMNIFKHKLGLHIDYLLVSETLKDKLLSVDVDETPDLGKDRAIMRLLH